jgi:hypothetical protein
VLGILVVFLAGPLLASPWPGVVAILARTAAGLLAARLLTIGLRGEEATSGTGIGWPAMALGATAAAVAGFASHGLGAAALGPPEAQAASFAVAALAIAPLFAGRDVLRIGVGATLLVQAGLLIRQALDGTATDGEQLVTSLLVIALGGAVAVIVAAARAAGGLRLAEDSTNTPLARPLLPRGSRAVRHALSARAVNRAQRSER